VGGYRMALAAEEAMTGGNERRGGVLYIRK